MKSVRSALCLATAFVIGLSAWCGAAEITIGYFDFVKFMGKSVRAQEHQKKIATLFEQKRKDLENKKKDIEGLREMLQKQAPMLKEDTRNAKIKDLSIKETEFKIAEQEAQTSLQSLEREIQEAMLKDLKKIVTDIRAEKKLTFIMNSQALMAADETMDVTDEAIRMYDAGAAAGAKAAPRPAPAKAPGAAPGKKNR